MQLSAYTEYRNRVDNNIKELLRDIEATTLLDALNYVSYGGKKLRAIITYLIGSYFKIPLSILDRIATSIELIHTYSLVHDDLPGMDNDAIRRGKPSCHVQFNEATAILVGDALLTLSFENISKLNHIYLNNPIYLNNCLTIINVLAKASGAAGMILGQHYDLAANNFTQNLLYLEKMHSLKTAALFSAALQMPYFAQPKEVDNKVLMQLNELAMHIGLAFQIQDDVLDVIETTETIGKPTGSDTKNNKLTFVSLLGVEGAIKRLKQECLAAYNKSSEYTELQQLLVMMFSDYLEHVSLPIT